MLKKIKETVSFIQDRILATPKVGVILGSGLGDLASEINITTKISYSDIPDFPVSTVKGHEGQLIFGQINNIEVVALQGRFHFYEGYNMVSNEHYVTNFKS